MRAIAERAAPSEYPLRPGPFENEWKYANWDPEDATQKEQLEKIHRAFYETFYGMAAQALSRFRDDDQTMIQRWFNIQEDPDEPREVFENMWNWDKGTATKLVSTMVCDREDYNRFCRDTMNAYTSADSGRFHICPHGLQKPLNSEILCDLGPILLLEDA